MINFTDTDRKFIRKLAASNDELLKRVAKLEKMQVPAKLQQWAQPSTGKSVAQQIEDNSVMDPLGGLSSVNVTFNDPSAVTEDQKAFIISLYKTLHELCAENGVESLSIVIKPDKML